jgi:hypothetical protein
VAAQWFSLRYGAASRWLLTAFASGPGRSGIAVSDVDVAVEMGVSFGGRAPLRTVTSARPLEETVVSRGVHGWRGDWLVNGAGDGLVEVRFEPPMKAHVIGVPVRVRRLRVSVEDPAGFAHALQVGAGV